MSSVDFPEKRAKICCCWIIFLNALKGSLREERLLRELCPQWVNSCHLRQRDFCRKVRLILHKMLFHPSVCEVVKWQCDSNVGTHPTYWNTTSHDKSKANEAWHFHDEVGALPFNRDRKLYDKEYLQQVKWSMVPVKFMVLVFSHWQTSVQHTSLSQTAMPVNGCEEQQTADGQREHTGRQCT